MGIGARRRFFFWLLGCCLPVGGAASTARTPRVGFIWNSLPAALHERVFTEHLGPRVLDQKLREYGWVRGRNLEVISLTAEMRYERLPGLVEELVRRRVDVIVVFGPEAAQVARERGTGIPIVYTVAFNTAPGRPGPGVTGMVVANPVDKRIELLKAIAPNATRLAMFAHAPPGRPGPQLGHALEQRIRAMGIEPMVFHFSSMEDLENAFRTASKRGVDAVYMSGFPTLLWDVEVQGRVLALASSARLPAVYEVPELAARGALVGLGPDVKQTHERAAYFVDRILRGSRPEDLPMEQPLGYLLALNRRTAAALGLTIPPAVLLQAQEVFD